MHSAGPSSEELDVLSRFEQYERALVDNDIQTMNSMFSDDPDVLRFGISDMQVGFDELIAWRATATPVSRSRTITSRHVRSLAPGAVAVDITFHNGDPGQIGRQSQTWVRSTRGWLIVRAHVSVIAAD